MPSSSPPNDLDRLRLEYQNRDQRSDLSERYSLFNPSYLFFVQQRQKAILKLLSQVGIKSLNNLRLLEVGCGGGDVLQEYKGLCPHVFGIDIRPEPLLKARTRFHLPVSEADGQKLPFMRDSFDIVLQYIAFSSILDASIKANMAQEMLRVLHKPNGIILWHDFWLNPSNPQTRGIGKNEIKTLFPDCKYTFQRITLAPPLARLIIPFSWSMGLFLEKFTFLNSHYLVAITPKASST